MTSSRESSSSRGDSTYRSVLSRKNPDIIDAWEGSSLGNTKSGRDAFDRVIFSGEADCTIQEWTDFTYEAINLAYGDLLDHVHKNGRPVLTPTITPTMIEDENGIDDLGKAWTCNIVRDPLKYAGAELRSRPTLCPQGAQSETDPVLGPRMKWTHPDLDGTELKPDWATYDRKVQKLYYSAGDKDGKKPLVFAIGDSKMCQKWKSAWIHRSLAKGHIDLDPARTASGRQLQKTHRVTAERLRPLEQLATYCRFGETRYGFILTQEELVAFRIRRLDPALIATGPGGTAPVIDKPHAGMEHKSIPWHASGPGKLTANLAIWALGCMGMNDHHRIMETSAGEPLDSMVRLTKWTFEDKEKVYRNDISGREITEEGWKNLGTAVAFVKLDDKKGGASYTSTFTSGDGVSSIIQSVGAVNLNTPAGRGRTPAQGATKQSKPADQGAASSSKNRPTDQVAASSSKPRATDQKTTTSSKTKAADHSVASSSKNRPTDQVAASSSKPRASNQGAASSSKNRPMNQGAATSSKPRPTDQGATSSSQSTPGATSPPKKFTIANKKGALTYEMGVSNGQKVLKMGKSQVPVQMDTKKKQYYYVDPNTKEDVYLVQV